LNKINPNSTYPKVAVQWFYQDLCFYQSFCLVDSEVLLNRHLRVAANHSGQVHETTNKHTITEKRAIKGEG
jgi:hypothetical protein